MIAEPAISPIAQAELVGWALRKQQAVLAVYLFGSIAQYGQGNDLDLLVEIADCSVVKAFNDRFEVHTADQKDNKVDRLTHVLEVIGDGFIPDISLPIDVFLVMPGWQDLWRVRPIYSDALKHVLKLTNKGPKKLS